jgi:Leucine-rich repeat (LRR) protein
MVKNSEKVIAEQKAAMTEALEEIEKCRKTHSKELLIGVNKNLAVFPEEIRQLTWLTSLTVFCTEIKELPEWVGNLKNLIELDISNNDIVVNPKNVIKKLHKLKEYDDCYNKFDSEDSNSKELEIPSFDLKNEKS